VARARDFRVGAEVGDAAALRSGALRRGEFLSELATVLRGGAAPWQVLVALRIDQAKTLAEGMGQGAAFTLEQAIATRFGAALAAGDAHSLWMQFGFGILARREDRESIEALARDLCARIAAEPFEVGGKAQRLTASVGIALAPTGADADPDRWFASAHAAQAIAHRLGGNRFDGVLSRDHGNLSPERVLIIREWVKEAVAGENVLIEFQPVLPLRGQPGLYRLDARLRDYRAPLAGVRRNEYLGLARDAGALPMIDRMSLFSAFEAIEQERLLGRATQVLVPLDLATLGESQMVWLDAELRRRKSHSEGLIVEFEAQMALGRPELVRVVQRLEDHGIVIALSDEAPDLSRLPQLLRFPASLLRLPLAAIDSVPPARFREALAPWLGSGRALVADGVGDIGTVSRLYELDIGFVHGDALAAGGPRLDYEFSQFGA
jgi:predicted signal transduction protein with EAL and GGDEF domain